MISPDDHEALRLAKLASLSHRIRSNMGLFQPIAEQAKRRFGVPIALVSVIDATSQVYLGNCGIGVTSMPRDQTFCIYTIRSPTVVVVEDTRADDHFRDHPFVRGEPMLRFYAGAPITVPGDLKLGTVCLADTRPRSFSRGDRMILEHLATTVVQRLASLPDAEPPDQPEAVLPIEGVADLGVRVGIRAWKTKIA